MCSRKSVLFRNIDWLAIPDAIMNSARLAEHADRGNKGRDRQHVEHNECSHHVVSSTHRRCTSSDSESRTRKHLQCCKRAVSPSVQWAKSFAWADSTIMTHQRADVLCTTLTVVERGMASQRSSPSEGACVRVHTQFVLFEVSRPRHDT